MKKYTFILLAAGCTKSTTDTSVPATNETAQSTETQSSAPATGNSITMAQVAEANTETKCWAVVSGSVYDLTEWIKKHPGGAAAIQGICGKDGTAAFSGQHGGQPQPEQALAGFKIGTLAK